MKTVVLDANLPEALDRAVELLQAGELIAFPTDTVYGVAGDLMNPQAIDKLYLVKGREASKAIPVLLGEVDQLAQVTPGMGGLAEQLAARFWPGPLTLVVPRAPRLPENLSSGPTLGVRMPDHPVALRLLRRAGPLAVTSANLSGGANTTTAQEVLDQLDGRIPLILDGGRTPGGQPSSVVDCTGPEPAVLRQGPISLEDILQALGRG